MLAVGRGPSHAAADASGFHHLDVDRVRDVPYAGVGSGVGEDASCAREAEEEATRAGKLELSEIID